MLVDYQYKTDPFAHQRELFERTRDLSSFAILWEQGTGKTKPTIDTVAWLYGQDKIDALLVVAPNGVHHNWMSDELPAHMPDKVMEITRMMAWRAPRAGTKWHARQFDGLVKHVGLAILCMSYDGFITERGKRAAWRFLQRRRVMYVLDESHHVKTPGAKRTKSIMASGRYAEYRRILTGTPADKPFDLYSQLRFIDPEIWRSGHMASFAAFKQHFGIWTQEQTRAGQFYPVLRAYKNLEELRDILASVSSRVLKDDVLDLPPKLYTRRYLDLSPRQATMYAQLRDELELELESGDVVDGTMAIVRLLRLQQITSGFVAAEAGEPVQMIPGPNPRLETTIDLCESLSHPAIIWARFRAEIDMITEALGDRAVRYDGTLDDEQAAQAKNAFNAGDKQFIVINSAKGSEGLTMNSAKTNIIHSNSFKLLQRLQLEDRSHRIGQDGAQHEEGYGVLYVDITAKDTVDEQIVHALVSKFDVASRITGDALRKWIQ